MPANVEDDRILKNLDFYTRHRHTWVIQELTSWSKLASQIIGQSTVCHLTCCTKDTTLLLWYIPSKNALSESNYEETSDEPKLKGILKNNWPVLLKNVKAMEEKG